MTYVNHDPKIFSYNLKSLIEERNLSLRDFASEASISVGMVSELIKGIKKPTKSSSQKICRYFGVRADWLLHGKEPKYLAQTAPAPTGGTGAAAGPEWHISDEAREQFPELKEVIAAANKQNRLLLQKMLEYAAASVQTGDGHKGPGNRKGKNGTRFRRTPGLLGVSPGDAYIAFDPETGKVLFANRAAKTMQLGNAPIPVPDKPVPDFQITTSGRKQFFSHFILSKDILKTMEGRQCATSTFLSPYFSFPLPGASAGKSGTRDRGLQRSEES